MIGQAQDLAQGLEVALAVLGAGRGGIAEVGVLAPRLGEGLGPLLERGHQAVHRGQADALALAHHLRRRRHHQRGLEGAGVVALLEGLAEGLDPALLGDVGPADAGPRLAAPPRPPP